MSLTNVFRVALSQTSHLASPWSHGDNQSQLPCGKPPGWEKCPSPLEALLLQQALERGQVPDVGCVVQPRVLAVLQGVVAELLPQPLLQVTTCAGDRAAGLSPAKRQVLKSLARLQGGHRATKEHEGEESALLGEATSIPTGAEIKEARGCPTPCTPAEVTRVLGAHHQAQPKTAPGTSPAPKPSPSLPAGSPLASRYLRARPRRPKRRPGPRRPGRLLGGCPRPSAAARPRGPRLPAAASQPPPPPPPPGGAVPFSGRPDWVPAAASCLGVKVVFGRPEEMAAPGLPHGSPGRRRGSARLLPAARLRS